MAYRELLCNVVNKHQTGVSFSISQSGILFPPEVGADVKAISVSGFTGMSLEPAKSQGQMSVLCWFLVQRTFVSDFHPCPSHLLHKRPRISQLREQNIPGITEAAACSWEMEEAASEGGERMLRGAGNILTSIPAPGPFRPLSSWAQGLKQRVNSRDGDLSTHLYSPLFTFASVLSSSTSNIPEVPKNVYAF